MGTTACVQLPWKCLHVLWPDHWKYPRLWTLLWRHNGHDSVSNHQPHDCLLNRLIQTQIKENIKALGHWPLCGEFTGDRWIRRSNGQLRGKWFHLMTSSWNQIFLSSPVIITQHDLSPSVWLCVTLKYPWYVPIASSRCITDMQMTLIHTLWVVWWKWSLNWSLKDSACGGYI